MAIDSHQKVKKFQYTLDDGTTIVSVKLGVNRAASAGFTAATTQPPKPAGLKLRHVGWKSDAVATGGSFQVEEIPCPKPNDPKYLGAPGGAYNYEGVAGHTTGRIGEKLHG